MEIDHDNPTDSPENFDLAVLIQWLQTIGTSDEDILGIVNREIIEQMEVSTNPKSVARRTSGETYPPFFDTLLSSPDYIPVLRRIAEHTDVSDPNERILVDFASTILPYIDKEAPLRLPPQPDYLAGSILYLLTEILKLPDPHPQIPSHCVQLLQNLCFNESSYMITLCLLKQLKVRYPGASSPINILLAFVDQTILELARTKEDKGILEGRSLLKIVFSGGWTFLPSIPALQTILQDNTITVELADSMVNSLSTILRKDTESPLHTEQTLSCYGLPPDAPPPSLFEELGILELLLEICFFSSNLKEHLPLSYFILLAYSILPKKEDNQILQVTLEELNTTAEQLQQFRIFIQRCSSYRGLQTALSDAENRALFDNLSVAYCGLQWLHHGLFLSPINSEFPFSTPTTVHLHSDLPPDFDGVLAMLIYLGHRWHQLQFIILHILNTLLHLHFENLNLPINQRALNLMDSFVRLLQFGYIEPTFVSLESFSSENKSSPVAQVLVIHYLSTVLQLCGDPYSIRFLSHVDNLFLNITTIPIQNVQPNKSHIRVLNKWIQQIPQIVSRDYPDNQTAHDIVQRLTQYATKLKISVST